MKKCWLSIVVLMLVYCSGKLFGQVPDTTAYLENIVKNKAQYIGKPFSTLEKDLKIRIIGYNPLTQTPMDISKEGSTVLIFGNLNKNTNFSEYFLFVIYWKSPLNMNETRAYFEKYHNYDWKDEIEEHYKNGIIRNIEVL